MGLTDVWVRVANPAKPNRSVRLKFLVDSGAVYSVVPAAALRRLGIVPRSTRSFILADGTDIKRKMAGALFTFQGEEGLLRLSSGNRATSHYWGWYRWKH